MVSAVRCHAHCILLTTAPEAVSRSRNSQMQSHRGAGLRKTRRVAARNQWCPRQHVSTTHIARQRAKVQDSTTAAKTGGRIVVGRRRTHTRRASVYQKACHCKLFPRAEIRPINQSMSHSIKPCLPNEMRTTCRRPTGRDMPHTRTTAASHASPSGRPPPRSATSTRPARRMA